MRNIAPFIKLLPFVILGILLGQVVTIRTWVVAIGAVLCTFMGYRLRSRWHGSLYTAVAVMLWALTTTSLRAPETITPTSTPQEFTATITSHPTLSGRWQRCDGEILIEGESKKILLNIDTASYAVIGQRGTLYGYLNALPEGSYGDLMSRRGYVGQVWATQKGDWVATDEATSPTIATRRLQQSLVERIERLGLGEKEEAVVEAMLLGWRGGITREMREDYSRAGASHLLAISGLHVGIVAMLVWWLCWLLPLTSPRGHLTRNLIAIGVMLLYATITGLSPSVVRATLMFCTAQVALLYGSSKSALNLLAGAVTVMLLVNPNNLFDISFQLSVVAVVGIAIGFKPMMSVLGEGGSGWLRTLKGVVVVGLCSTIATLPLVAHTFGTVSLVGIFLNPIVILTAEIIVLMGFIWVTLPLDFLAPLFRSLIGGAAELQNGVAEVASSLRWSAAEVNLPGWMVVVCYLLMAAGVVVAMIWKEKKEWKIER